MDDLISRQAAINALVNAGLINYAATGNSNGMIHALNVIKALPSAQPQRKKGHWIIKDNPGTGWYRVTCSECGEDVTSTVPVIGYFPNAKVLWDFCPNCGTQMNGGEQDD